LLPIGYAELAANRGLSPEKRSGRTDRRARKPFNFKEIGGVAKRAGGERSLEVRIDQPG